MLDIEGPIDRQLQKNVDLGMIVHCLTQEQELLQQKVDQEEYLYYYQQNQLEPEELEATNVEPPSSGISNPNQDTKLSGPDEQDSDAEEGESPSIQENKINLGGEVGQVDMNALKNQDKFAAAPARQTLQQLQEEFTKE